MTTAELLMEVVGLHFDFFFLHFLTTIASVHPIPVPIYIPIMAEAETLPSVLSSAISSTSVEELSISSFDSTKLYSKLYTLSDHQKQPKASVLFVHGFIEYIDRYTEKVGSRSSSFIILPIPIPILLHPQPTLGLTSSLSLPLSPFLVPILPIQRNRTLSFRSKRFRSNFTLRQ